ncbi:MAG: hypothetical protein JWO79_19 [Actinomycetia bacterium]|nr:hypothetical protein [Actinomycetes bacterium]
MRRAGRSSRSWGLPPLLEELRAHRDRLPRGDPRTGQIDALLNTVGPLLGAAAGGPIDPAAFGPLRGNAERPELDPTERALRLCGLGMAELAGGQTDAAVEHLREAVTIGPDSDSRKVECLMALGHALVQRYEDHRKRRDVVEAIEVLERARGLTAGPAHPHWAQLSITLGWAQRLRGQRPLGRRTGQDALLGHTVAVLLQSGTAAATAAARHAASEALDVARWCLEDNDAVGAAQALDAGRGLVLQAAVRFGTVTDQLMSLGDDELAHRWRHGG